MLINTNKTLIGRAIQPIRILPRATTNYGFKWLKIVAFLCTNSEQKTVVDYLDQQRFFVIQIIVKVLL